jgi:Lrp/AsnC family leucine-responsive transcriptional regulator
VFDELDFLLINKLQQDARKPVAQLARELGRPTATVRDRLRRLENMSVIQGYTAVIDLAQIGFPIKALIHVSVSERIVDPDEFVEALGRIPEVVSADLVTGDYEAVVTVRVRDIEHLRRILYDDIPQIPGVTSTNTSIVLLERQMGSGHPRSLAPPTTYENTRCTPVERYKEGLKS